jgi:hypothetical protein
MSKNGGGIIDEEEKVQAPAKAQWLKRRSIFAKL